MSGREDASGGIVFRFAEGRYYVIRANALEDNFRLYYYDQGRRMLTTAAVKPPTLGQWHTLQISAKRERLQGWLNDKQLIDHRDSRFTAGRIGLWTKADSITAFGDLYPMITLKWNHGVHNFMVYGTGDIPVGATVTATGSFTVDDPDPGNKVLAATISSPVT